MKLTNLTDPLTGLKHTAIRMSDGALTLDTAFDGTLTLQYDKLTDSYVIPASLLRYRRTMTLAECADYLKLSRMRVSRMCRDGNLKAAKVNGAMVIDAESARRAKEKSDD